MYISIHTLSMLIRYVISSAKRSRYTDVISSAKRSRYTDTF